MSLINRKYQNMREKTKYTLVQFFSIESIRLFDTSTVVSLSPSHPLSQGTSAVPMFAPLVEVADAHSGREFYVFFTVQCVWCDCGIQDFTRS